MSSPAQEIWDVGSGSRFLATRLGRLGLGMVEGIGLPWGRWVVRLPRSQARMRFLGKQSLTLVGALGCLDGRAKSHPF